MKTVKHYSTIGLIANHNSFKVRKLVRVCFDVKEDDTVQVYAVNGHNLSEIRIIPKITITRDELSNLDDDPCNNVVFARAAFALLGLSVE